MQSNIALIGYGQTRFGEWWHKSLHDLLREAADAALSAAPCTALDIDLVVVSNMLGERLSDQAHLGSVASGLLPHHPPALRVESACGSGAYALHTACAMLESGRARNVLVVGAEKMTDAPTESVAAALMGASDAEKEGACGLTFPGIFGLICTRYMHEYGLTRDDLSIVSAVHHRYAMENPFAQFRAEVTPENVSASSPVADPLRLLDCSPVSDGAAACVLSSTMEAPVTIVASQIAGDALSLTERPALTSFGASKDAAERALREAEISTKDIAALETHDCFSIAAIINLEDLGFANPGEGIALYKALYEGSDTQMSINRSGGLKGCGHPVGATGIKQVIDVAKELERRGDRYGMAHNFGGSGATCGIHILEHSPRR